MRILWVLGLVLAGCTASADVDGGAPEDAPSDAAPPSDAAAPDSAAPDAGDGGSPEDASNDAGPPAPPGPWTVYVNVAGEDRVAVVDLSRDGVASERTAASLSLGESPTSMARDPATGRLYVGSASGAIVTLAVDGAGAPRVVGRTTGVANPVYLAIAPGARLLSGYYQDNLLRVHDIAGAPPHAELDSLATAPQPHATTLGPSGLFYVPHRAGDATWWVRLDGDGTLEQVGALAAEPGAGPRHIAFHPSGAYAYVVGELDDSVSTHTVAADGALTRVATVSALPSGVDGDANTAADIHVSEDGRYVFSSNRGHDSIARFSVGADGRLTFLGATPTEARPREFELTPGGGYLLALGQDSGEMRVHAIGDDGSLTSLGAIAIGADLRWAVAVPQ